MSTNLTATKLLGLTLAVIASTVFLLGIVIFEDPPGFFGYFFGFLNGAAWICWLWIFLNWQDNRRNAYDRFR